MAMYFKGEVHVRPRAGGVDGEQAAHCPLIPMSPLTKLGVSAELIPSLEQATLCALKCVRVMARPCCFAVLKKKKIIIIATTGEVVLNCTLK